jgi:chromosome segregation ATPase
MEKAKELLEKGVKPSLWYALEKDPKLASELISRMFEEVLAVIVKVDQDLSSKIAELTENLSDLSKRTDEINAQLSGKIAELTENVNNLSKRADEMNIQLSSKIAELSENVNEINMQLSKRIAELTENLSDLSKRTDEINAQLSSRIAELTENLNNLSKRTDEINAQLSGKIAELTENVNRLSKRADEINMQLSSRIAELTENLNNLSKRTDEINAQLSGKIAELTENVNRLSKTVNGLASTVGRLDRRYAKLRETELRQDLRDLCFKRGLEVDRGFIIRGKPEVDAVITGRKVVALVEIAMRGGSKDIRQLLRASEAYEEIYKVRPRLFLLCVEEPDELTIRRAEEKGVIVTMRPGEIARELEKAESE